jgi:hypothetical protein
MEEEKKKYQLRLVGWKAKYSDKDYSSEEGHEWKDIPREGMLLLQRFYNIFDEEGEKYIQDGKDVFSEDVYGQSIVALTVDAIKKYKKLPKEIKFMRSISKEDIEKIKNKEIQKMDELDEKKTP